MENNLKRLQFLLGDYHDEEQISYALFKKEIINNGIFITLDDIFINTEDSSIFIKDNFFKINPTIPELLALKTFNGTFLRKNTHEIYLFNDEVYSIFLEVGDAKIDLNINQSDYGFLKKRYTETTFFKHHQILYFLNNELIQQINQEGKLRFFIQAQNVKNSRNQFEVDHCIFNTDSYVLKNFNNKKILNLYNSCSHFLKKERTFINIEELEYLAKIESSTIINFGVQDIISLRYIYENITDEKISNKKIFNSYESILTKQSHLIFQHFLKNKISF